jgi:hypothetical protein
MEVLSLVDESESSFVHAAELFEGLTAIRPKVVNEPLSSCRSLKVKRLFLFLGSRYQAVTTEPRTRREHQATATLAFDTVVSFVNMVLLKEQI